MDGPSQSECSSSPEPSTSEDAVPSRGEEEEEDPVLVHDDENDDEDEDYSEEDEEEEEEEEEQEQDEDDILHGEISNPPSPLGGRAGRASDSEHEVISSSTGLDFSRRRPPSRAGPPEETLIDSTVDSSGVSRLSAPAPPLEDQLICQSSSSFSQPPPVSTSAHFSNDDISTTTNSSGREDLRTLPQHSNLSLRASQGNHASQLPPPQQHDPQPGPSRQVDNHVQALSERHDLPPSRKRAPFEESNGISSSSSSHEPIPSTSSGLSHQEESSSSSLQIGQAFSGIPQSFLLGSSPPPMSSQNGTAPVTSSHSSILESLSGPLSKRLRTLHHLQQRGDEPSSSPPPAERPALIHLPEEEQPAQSSSQSVDSSGSNSSDDPSSSNNEDEHPLPGTSSSSSSYGTQQTFSVTVESPSSRSHLSWNQGGMSKARASLPEDLLFLKSEEEGVFAKKDIPSGHRFGPLQGLRIKPFVKESDRILFLVHKDKPVLGDGYAGSRIIDVSDEGQSNWLRFVRQATTFSEQNLSLSQEDEELYFTSTKAISPDEELKVWYSEKYAKVRKLPLLEGTVSASQELENQENTEPPEPPGDDHRETEEQQEVDDGPQPQESTWPCFRCQVICSSSKSLQKHLNTAHQSPRFNRKKASRRRIYKCSSCYRAFLKLYSLRVHVAVFHSRKKHDNCKSCGLKFAHPGALECYVKRSSRNNNNNNVMRSSKSMNTNCIASAPRQQGIACATCGLMFKQSATSDLHSLSHFLGHNPQENPKWKDLRCPDCHLEQSSFLELVNHSTSHGFKEKEKENIAANNTNQASGSSSLQYQGSLQKEFKCVLCHKKLFTAERLQRHLILHKHDELKSMACSECGKLFLSKSALICHLKVHSGGKRSYDCPICGEIFHQVIQLKEHVHIHRINNQYTCPHCSKVFSEYALIRKHIRAFHSEKKFSCPHCDKSFTGADKLKVHMVKHSDVREFICNECGKQFKRKDKLKEHSKRMHPPPVDEFNQSNSDKQESPQQISLKICSVDYRSFIYKCHKCMLGFKRRGMLVNHLANRHPEISIQSVPELNLPILKVTRNYYCQYCNKVYKSSSKRKSHILKNHPGLDLPVSVRDKAAVQQVSESIGGENPTFSATVGSVTSQPHKCEYCHKQYASKPKLLQHHRKKHGEMLDSSQKLIIEQRQAPSTGPSSGESVSPPLINFNGLQQQHETYRLSAAGVAFVPFIPKNDSPTNGGNAGFVTINATASGLKGGHHLIVEGPPASSLEPSHLEHLINTAQIHVDHHPRAPSTSSSWMSST